MISTQVKVNMSVGILVYGDHVCRPQCVMGSGGRGGFWKGFFFHTFWSVPVKIFAYSLIYKTTCEVRYRILVHSKDVQFLHFKLSKPGCHVVLMGIVMLEQGLGHLV